MIDVTERRELEEQVRRMQRLESIGQLTGGVAHDFNNLLTVILGNIDLVNDRAGDDERLRHLTGTIKLAAERGAELSQRLLAFARRQPLQPQAVDVSRLIASMDGLLVRALGEQIDVELVDGTALWPALVDPSQLEAALLNITLNARDAMAEGGKLIIETANQSLTGEFVQGHDELQPGEYVMLAITDTGIGMSADVRQRAVEPFFTTKEFGQGSGLGLSMVYGFVKQSGGHLGIDSKVGQGTTVRLYLPRATAEVVVAEAPHRSALPAVCGGETILVVEDDELVRAYVEGQLRDLGYDVIAMADGPAALRALAENGQVDLLFSDVVMPGGMNGPQLVQAAVRLRPDLKVLFTSGYSESAIADLGRLDGDVQLLQKPYRREDLAARLRQVLDAG
jgi:nitrogen-specific signal transduction histidine kinase